MLLWDHVLTFPTEVGLIWFRRPDITQVVFVFNRYAVEGGLLYSAYSEQLLSFLHKTIMLIEIVQGGFRPRGDVEVRLAVVYTRFLF